MGRTVDVRKQEQEEPIIYIKFAEPGGSPLSTSDDLVEAGSYILIREDSGSGDIVRVRKSDIANLIKALQLADKEWKDD